jgi:hypothetical protein
MDYKEHFNSCWPEEGVGYIKDDKFYPLENIATDKLHQFEVNPKFLLEQPDLLLHSHCVGRDIHYDGHPKSPTYEDLVGQLTTDIEWGICVTDGETCEEPVYWGNLAHRPPLLDREFIFNIQDCYTLVQDWFYQKRGISLPNQARTPHWNEEGHDLLAGSYEQWGFVKIELEDIQPGDVVFYQVRSPVINHLGVYLGNNEIISHWYGRISCIESFGIWANYIQFAARYNDNSND